MGLSSEFDRIQENVKGCMLNSNLPSREECSKSRDPKARTSPGKNDKTIPPTYNSGCFPSFSILYKLARIGSGSNVDDKQSRRRCDRK